MKPEVTTYALVFADGSAVRSQVVNGCEKDAFAKLEAHHGKFNAHLVSPGSFPTDDEFRGAWIFEGGRIGHDMTKAKAIFRDRIRAARKPVMAALDVQYMRAQESGGDTASIVQAKQRLRDAPDDPSIEAATTVAELKTAWPL